MLNFTAREAKFIEPDSPLAELAVGYADAMLQRERSKAEDLVFAALDAGESLKNVYLYVLQPVQYEIGWLWQTNQITVAHEHFCTNATQVLMSRLYPRLFSGEPANKRLLAACVQGELHELGMRMLSDFFEMDGWNTEYLGANMPHRGIVQAVAGQPTDVLAIGVTLRGHLPGLGELIEQVRATAAGHEVKILMGGFGLRGDDELWRRLGADGTAKDAGQAIALANSLTVDGSDAADSRG